MTRRGAVRVAGAASVFLLAAAGCGSSGSDSPGGATSSPEPATPTACSSPSTEGGIGQCGPGGAAAGGGNTGPAGSGATGSGAAAAPGKAGTVHIGGTGDILAHVGVWKNANANAGGTGYDFTPMFAEVKDRISALDVAICHLETPLSKDNTNLSQPNTMVFNVPHELAGDLVKVGYDGCDRVGNHTLDRGVKGIASTSDVMTAAGLKQQGPPAASVDHQEAVTYDAKGMKVAQLAYGYTSVNAAASNTDVPAYAPWLKYWQFPVVKAEGILADAKRARAAGADVVVVSLHWGVEYSSQASPEQRELAKTLLESPDVDLILGTHVHVAQPCEKINGKYVVYGMGNFLSNQGPASASSLKPATQDGMIVDVELTRGQDGKVEEKLTYQPTHVRLSDHHVQLATPTQNPEAYQRVTWAMSQLGDKCDAKPAS